MASHVAIGTRLWPTTGYGMVRVCLGFLLLAAAGLKAHQLATEPVLGEGLFHARWFLIVTVEFELFFGLWLLAGLLPRVTWAVAVGCFCLFGCVSLYKALSGATSCGCFGRVEVNPWYTFTLDFLCVVALFHWRPAGAIHLFWSLFSHKGDSGVFPDAAGTAEVPPNQGWFSRFLLAEHGWASFPVARTLTVVGIWLTLGVPAAVAMGAYAPSLLDENGIILGSGNVVVLEPEKWVGKRFPLLPYIEDAPGRLMPGERPLRDRLAKGQWLVVLYHHDCVECRRAMPKYAEQARRSVGKSNMPRVALVEIPPCGARDVFGIPLDTPCAWGRLSDERKWFVETPVRLRVNDGVMDVRVK